MKKSTDPTPAILKRYAYGYDVAGNRSVEQIDDAVIGSSHDTLNRLSSQQPSGMLRVTGTVNEAATVMVAGKTAVVAADNSFEGAVPIASGTSTFAVVATDTNNNVTSDEYEIENLGSSKTFTYDANGNLTADGTRTFEWDAENRLTAVVIGANRSEFTYDGLDRRVRIVEKQSGTTVRDARFIWIGTAIAEERLSTGEITRFFAGSEEHDGVDRYFTRDHLGSIREVTDSTQTVLTRNEYDPYGRVSRVVGSVDSRFGFTGHYRHAESGLMLAMYRQYDPTLGRWLTEDPIGLADGVNRYGYVGNAATGAWDPFGLWTYAKEYGTNGSGLSSNIVSIEAKVDKAFQEVAGRDAVVTYSTNGKHKKGSKHYDGDAIDLRDRDLTPKQKTEVLKKLKDALGADYDVILEGKEPHIHIEYDPKDRKPSSTKPRNPRC